MWGLAQRLASWRGFAAAAVAGFVLMVAGLAVPDPAPWIGVGRRVALDMALLVAAAYVSVHLRAWGSVSAVVRGPWLLLGALVIIEIGPVLAGGYPQPVRMVNLVLQVAVSVVLVALVWDPERLAARLPRRPEWEILHAISALAATRRQLDAEALLARTPELKEALAALDRFRSPATAEFLDLLPVIDPLGLVSGDRVQTDSREGARYLALQAGFVARFAPYSTWHVRAT